MTPYAMAVAAQLSPWIFTTETATPVEVVPSGVALAAGWAAPRRAAKLALRTAIGSPTAGPIAGLLRWAAAAVDNPRLVVRR